MTISYECEVPVRGMASKTRKALTSKLDAERYEWWYDNNTLIISGELDGERYDQSACDVPYPTPNLIDQAHWKIIDAVSFVDKIIFGRTNYNPEVTAYLREDKNFYNEISREVADLCKYYAIDCHIKDGTQTGG